MIAIPAKAWVPVVVQAPSGHDGKGELLTMDETQGATADRAREEVMREIAALLGISGGLRSDEFWYDVAVNLNVGIPADGTPQLVRQVLEFLDEEWDEDYLEDDGARPALEAYETLHSRLTSRDDSDTAAAVDSSEPEEDEDDDAIGSVGTDFMAREAQTTQTDIDTQLNRIGRGTLILNPDWQRGFVWKLKKQRRLIESILLGLPIPSLLLFRDSSSGSTYVIDGRQRLETISRFTAGKPAPGEEKRRFKTFPASTEGWRAGEKLHAAAGKYYDDLPPEFRSKFDQAALVLHTFVDLPREKLYQIFRRYNTGAEQLRAAEIRNAVYQASPLHKMMYQLAGEQGLDGTFDSEEEREAAETLHSIMKRKVARYGAYDFVGRYFAFSRMSTGSVANATNEFMARFETADVSELRKEFIAVLNKTCEWYEYPLMTPRDSGAFHAFLATIQMVATRELLSEISAGRADESLVRNAISEKWPSYAEEILEQKQNATAFWSRQREWIDELKQSAIPHAGPSPS
jgi:hypothetical protein